MSLEGEAATYSRIDVPDAESPVYEAIARLDKAVAEHDLIVQNIASRLGPVLAPESDVIEAEKPSVAEPQRGTLATRLRTIREGVEAQTHFLLAIRDRLEI